jgi:hypothetical protein
MDYDSFHFVHVLDENLKTLAVLNENEILDSIVKYSSGMSFGELLEINYGNSGHLNI